MSLNHPYQSENYTPAYQISAMPFLTSSTIPLGTTKQIEFDYVTRFITVRNLGTTGSVLALAFTEQGLLPAKSNYFIISGSQEYTGELRSTRLFLSGVAGTSPYSLLAGLTTIPARMMLPITGSNGYPGVG